MVAGGKENGGLVREFGIHMYTLLYLIHTAVFKMDSHQGPAA